jgi:carbon-monoxide dehydrogenase medium subunit
MYNVELQRPATLAEASKLLAKTGGKVLAGGQTIIAAMKLRLANPGTLIDLGSIPGMDSIKREGDALIIGAAARHADVAASPEVRKVIPALAQLAEGIGDRQVRNMGTIGGSLANNDPAACYPAAVLGLGATIETSKRKIAADDFFKGMYETVLDSDEIITAVRFPVPRKAGYVKFPNPASRFAIVGVMVSEGPAGVRVAVTGAGPCVFRVPEMEKALAQNLKPDAVSSIRVDPAKLNSDLHASAEYRAHLVTVIAARAVTAALAA